MGRQRFVRFIAHFSSDLALCIEIARTVAKLSQPFADDPRREIGGALDDRSCSGPDSDQSRLFLCAFWLIVCYFDSPEGAFMDAWPVDALACRSFSSLGGDRDRAIRRR